MTGTVLITGAAGQLGYELQQCVPDGVHVVALARDAMDVTDAGSVERAVSAAEPQVIINAAAYTAVDRAESDGAGATAVNVAGARHLAEAARRHGARVLHVSTDFVFGTGTGRPWRPDDGTDPLSVYGRTKRDGESALLDVLGDRALVVRTAWLYSVHGANFVKTMLRLMRERDEVRVVSDQVGTPTWAKTLAGVLWAAVAEPRVGGILHWTDSGAASWYDFAVAIEEEGASSGLLHRRTRVTPIRAVEYPTPAQRPSYAVLDTTETTRLLAVTPQHWRISLRRMLEELPGA